MVGAAAKSKRKNQNNWILRKQATANSESLKINLSTLFKSRKWWCWNVEVSAIAHSLKKGLKETELQFQCEICSTFFQYSVHCSGQVLWLFTTHWPVTVKSSCIGLSSLFQVFIGTRFIQCSTCFTFFWRHTVRIVYPLAPQVLLTRCGSPEVDTTSSVSVFFRTSRGLWRRCVFFQHAQFAQFKLHGCYLSECILNTVTDCGSDLVVKCFCVLCVPSSTEHSRNVYKAYLCCSIRILFIAYFVSHVLIWSCWLGWSFE